MTRQPREENILDAGTTTKGVDISSGSKIR
ncbi:hypothetical protein LINPERPRIM_LOCUS14925 [Linum perenne]